MVLFHVFASIMPPCMLQGERRFYQVFLFRCVSLGVPPGDLVGELRAGRPVVLGEEGETRTVRPEDVASEATPKKKCLVVDCPTEHHLVCMFGKKKKLEFI